jgi:hypothetical protein
MRQRQLEEALVHRKRSSRIAIKESEKEEAELAAKKKAEEDEKMGRARRLEARQQKEEAEREKREAAREQRRREREQREQQARHGPKRGRDARFFRFFRFKPSCAQNLFLKCGNRCQRRSSCQKASHQRCPFSPTPSSQRFDKRYC